MNDIIILEETNCSTHAAQGMYATYRKGFDIWYKENSQEMYWLGFIDHDKLDDTIYYYKEIDPGIVEIKMLDGTRTKVQ